MEYNWIIAKKKFLAPNSTSLLSKHLERILHYNNIQKCSLCKNKFIPTKKETLSQIW